MNSFRIHCRSRLTTNGIIETDFIIDDHVFKMFDVGGQRGERKKWIHCFDNVTAIMFIASLSEYDQVLFEDRTRNRMVESLHLFEGMCNLPWLKTVPILLFLNKEDLFKVSFFYFNRKMQEKFQRIDLGIYFPEYVGGLDEEAGLDFIRSMFFERNKIDGKEVYCHTTTATNTDNVEFVWEATKSIILQHSLEDAQIV